ncbi:MAG: prenyltransferase/squalene oxidase repeat-containing protein [Patescibacteria group bacterium]
MGYFRQLTEAADWLVTHQNLDGGWGLSPKQASSVVNTAESIFILVEANHLCGTHYSDQILKGFEFIWRQLLEQLEKYPRTRYVQFALWNFPNPIVDYPGEVKRYTEWLLGAQNDDGGWGHHSKDGQSSLFPSVLSLLVLNRLGTLTKESRAKGISWLLSKRDGKGLWGFVSGQQSKVATAQAVHALVNNKYEIDDSAVKNLIDFLSSDLDWGVEIENVPGTKWEHSKVLWIVPSLLLLGTEPYEHVIADAVRKVNTLRYENGWKEPDGAETIRGQFWITSMYAKLHKAFDPAIVTYRIESALSIQKQKYLEPEYVHLLPSSKYFRFVFHSRWYRIATYFCFFSSFCILFLVPTIDLTIKRSAIVSALSVLTVSLFASSLILIKKRKSFFPPWISKGIFPIIIGIIIVFEIVSAALGISVQDIYKILLTPAITSK